MNQAQDMPILARAYRQKHLSKAITKIDKQIYSVAACGGKSILVDNTYEYLKNELCDYYQKQGYIVKLMDIRAVRLGIYFMEIVWDI